MIRSFRQAACSALQRSVSVKAPGAVLLGAGETSSSSLLILQRGFSTPPAAEKIVLPPNLKIDPRSSFAPIQRPQRMTPPPAVDEEERQEKEEEDDDDEEEDTNKEEEEYHDDDEEEDETLYLTRKKVAYVKPLPDRLNAEVHTLFAPQHSSLTGTIILEESVFGLDPIRVDLLKRAVDYYRAKKRGRRLAKTKTISEVSGSGRKVRKQKGGGIARAGHSRPPHWRGGAKAHGPKNTTDYGNTKLNKKVRKLALRHAFSQKLKEGNLLLFNEMTELPTHKTKELVRLLEPWGMCGPDGASTLLLDHYYAAEDAQVTSQGGMPINLYVASKNIVGLKVGNSHAANVYDILKYEKLALTVSALQQIEARYKDDD